MTNRFLTRLSSVFQQKRSISSTQQNSSHSSSRERLITAYRYEAHLLCFPPGEGPVHGARAEWYPGHATATHSCVVVTADGTDQQGLLFLLANGSSVLHGCFRPGRTLPPPHSLPPGVSKSGPHTPQAMEVGPCPTRTSTAVAGPEPLVLAPSAQHTSAEYWPDVPESSVAQQ